MNRRLIATSVMIASMLGIGHVVTSPDLPLRADHYTVTPELSPQEQVRNTHWSLVKSYCDGDAEGMLETISKNGVFSAVAGYSIGRDTLRVRLEEKLSLEDFTCDDVSDVANYNHLHVFSTSQAGNTLLSDGTSLLEGVQHGGFQMQPDDFVAVVPLVGQSKDFLLGVYRKEDDTYRVVLLR